MPGVDDRNTAGQQRFPTVTCVYTAPPTGGIRSDQAYRELKSRLLAGDFQLGRRLGEERLAELVGTSRTPVREALVRLHADGLVRRGDDGGYEPVAPDVSAVRHLYEVRVVLELAALQRPARAGERHDQAALDRLRADWTELRLDLPEADPSFVLLDEEFHVGLAEAGGNPALAAHLRQINERIRVVRMHDFRTDERIVTTVDEHLGILDAVATGDVTEAERRFMTHLDLSVAVVEERVARAIARMAEAS